MTELFDISHWNTITDWQKVASKISGIGIKFSQGNYYADPKAREHYENAGRVGLKRFPYHFVTKDKGQYEWFMECTKGLTFELAPMMDCEAYNTITTADQLMSLTNMPGMNGEFLKDVEKEYPVRELRYGNINEVEAYKMGEILGYTYPTEAIIDVMGRKLMGFQGFPMPVIYTNPASGNAIFKSPSMRKYLLHIAHWGVKKPTLPKVWTGEDWYMWQDGVIEFDGVQDKVDHNIWGKKVKFPEDTTPPPPPVSSKWYVVAYPGGVKHEGTIEAK